MKTLLSLGHGYCARCLSRLLSKRGGWRVVGTTRTAGGIDRVIDSGAEARLWDDDSVKSEFAAATHILVSIAPDADGDPVLERFTAQLMKETPELEWVGYLSTTSVYGNCSGAWVDESAKLAPTTDRGRFRVGAEQAWREWSEAAGIPLHIFRLAGIYGLGRGPLHQLKTGRKAQVVVSGQYFNRIHVEDIAQVLFASMQKTGLGSVYNVCDDLPARSIDVMKFAAEAAGVPLPDAVAIADAKLSGMAKSFYSESKRVRNGLIKTQLGVDLLYPDYRCGIRALAAEDQDNEGRRNL